MLRLLLAILLFAGSAAGQTLPVLFLSDLHFDPLRDPGKAAQLAAADESRWSGILRAPATATQAADFAALQAKCGARLGLDADYTVLTASLRAAAAQLQRPDFISVSGDLVVHGFECRWRLATGSDQGYAAFAEKTSRFVMDEIEAAFAGTPVYLALGNNDSSCGDYRMDLDDRYLQAMAPVAVRGLIGATARERTAATDTIRHGGYFSVRMPGTRNGRVIALDDIYLAHKYSTCAGKHDPAPAAAVIRWLDAELAAAKQRGEHVWVIAHMPPGLDVYTTIARPRDICGGAAPEFFLEDNVLAATLEKYAGTVQLAVLGHTHNDELRLLGQVPAKLIASVTPVNGNLPSFTVGELDPGTAQLQDYSVFVAHDALGAAPWSREYRYRESFGDLPFTSAHLAREIDGFVADPQAQSPESQRYQQDFYPGAESPLGVVWPQAACALGNITAETYRTCVCKAGPTS